MAKTNQIPEADILLIPPSEYNAYRAQPYKERAIDDNGREVLSPISLVADVDMNPLSLGEQMARFVKSPDFLYDGDDDDDLELPDDDVDPMSQHEDRYLEVTNKLHAAREERREKRRKAREEEEERKLDAYAERLKARKEASDQPPAPPTGEGA